MSEKIRIAKLIADRGYASRRQAEVLIAEGVVYVNDVQVKSPAEKFLPSDVIEVEGMVLNKRSTSELYAFYKPKECLCTRTDPQGRTTIYDILPRELENFHYIGRLDYNTEGLLLLTNDSALKRTMELPTSSIERVYKVRYYGKLSESDIRRIEEGITVDGMRYKQCKIELGGAAGRGNNWLEMTLYEGKNREIRNIFEYFHCNVSRLIRVRFDKYSLGDMELGEVTKLKSSSAIK